MEKGRKKLLVRTSSPNRKSPGLGSPKSPDVDCPKSPSCMMRFRLQRMFSVKGGDGRVAASQPSSPTSPQKLTAVVNLSNSLESLPKSTNFRPKLVLFDFVSILISTRTIYFNKRSCHDK